MSENFDPIQRPADLASPRIDQRLIEQDHIWANEFLRKLQKAIHVYEDAILSPTINEPAGNIDAANSRPEPIPRPKRINDDFQCVVALSGAAHNKLDHVLRMNNQWNTVFAGEVMDPKTIFQRRLIVLDPPHTNPHELYFEIYFEPSRPITIETTLY